MTHVLGPELDECSERNSRVRAVEHAGPVSACSGVHQLLLRRVLYDAIRVTQGDDGTVNGHGVSDLWEEREWGGMRQCTDR